MKRKTHILGVHDVAALANTGDGLMGVDQQRLQGGGDGPRLAVPSTRVRRYVELHAVRDADLSRVAWKQMPNQLETPIYLRYLHVHNKRPNNNKR